MDNLINILIILLIIFLFSYFYYNHYYNNNNHNNNYNYNNNYNNNLTINKKCWINNDLFPQANEIFNSKNVIKDELNNILDNDHWAIWSNDYKKTPNFSNMNQDDIIKRLNNNSSKINSSEKPAWRLFGLILNKNILPNAKYCPNTLKILNKYSDKILNAGFSLLEAGSYIGSHKDYNNKFYRLHIPLIIPKNNNKIKNSFISIEKSNDNLCVLQVENDFRVWKDDEYFIFDDTCQHNAWNNTTENRIILMVDLLK